MKKVIVSAPGKLHLSGEHAVVYGKPALVVATSLRLFVSLDHAIKGVLLSEYRKKDVYIDAIVGAFEKKCGVLKGGDVCMRIDSAIPISSGMGSSAALAVALVGALSVWHGLSWNVAAINDAAYQAEKMIHKNSSGSDPAIATHGGILWYRKEMEFLKTLWLLPFKIPKSFAPFVLINTGRSESTGDLVAYVGAKKQKNEPAFALLLNDIEAVTKRAAESIHDEDESGFREAMVKNERLLEKMGVVSATAGKCITAIEQADGVAKISGAGGQKKGSGVIIGMHDAPVRLTAIAKSHGYPSFQVALGGQGVKMEQVLT